MTYLIDTDILIFALRRKGKGPVTRLTSLEPGDGGISVISYAELCHGALKSIDPEGNLAALARLRAILPVLPFNDSAAMEFGRIRAVLERSGERIGAYDLLIAAHALSLGLTLVTNNTREFGRVPGLEVENWAEERPPGA